MEKYYINWNQVFNSPYDRKKEELKKIIEKAKSKLQKK